MNSSQCHTLCSLLASGNYSEGVCCGGLECDEDAQKHNLGEAALGCVCNKFWTGDNCDERFDDYMGHIIPIARVSLAFCFLALSLVALQQVLHEIHLGRDKDAARAKGKSAGVGSLRFWLNLGAFCSAFLFFIYDVIRTAEGSRSGKDNQTEDNGMYKFKKVLEQMAYSFTILGLMILVVLIAEVDTSRSAKRAGADGQTKLFKSRRSTIVLQATFGSYIFLIAAGLIVLIVTENSSKAMITLTYFLYGAVFLSVAARFVFSVVRKTRKSIETMTEEQAFVAKKKIRRLLLLCVACVVALACLLIKQGMDKILKLPMDWKPGLYIGVNVIFNRLTFGILICVCIYWAHDSTAKWMGLISTSKLGALKKPFSRSLTFRSSKELAECSRDSRDSRDAADSADSPVNTGHSPLMSTTEPANSPPGVKLDVVA